MTATLLDSFDLVADSSSEDLSIATTSRDLLIVGSLRSTRAADALDRLQMLLGTGSVVDTGANYNYRSSDNFTEDTSAAASLFSVCRNSWPAANSDANTFGPLRMVIPDYADTSKEKTVMARAGFYDGSGNGRWGRLHGTWENTGAIDIIRFTFLNGDIASGSSVSVYGLS